MNNWLKKSCGVVLIIALIFSLSGAASAANGPTVLQVYTEEDTMTVFTSANLGDGEIGCAVSGQTVEVGSAGALADGDGIVKTTILIDVSMSIPKAMRSVVVDAVDKLIERKTAEEEYRLVTFDEELTVLQDFTSERYDLASALSGVVFDGQMSMIYDAIYNTLPDIGSADGSPTLYRTIVITDGADESANGITMEELFLTLQSKLYPVDVLAVSEDAGQEKKELSAISRISNGRYSTLTSGTDLNSLEQALGIEDLFWFTVTVPGPLLDGSVRQVDISSDGHSMSVDVKFPATYAPVATPSPEPTPEATPTPAPTPQPQTQPPVASEPEPSFLEEYGLFLALGIGALLIVLAVILIIVFRKRKRTASSMDGANDSKLQLSRPVVDEKTEFFEEGAAEFTIRLSDSRNPENVWTLQVSGDVLIGRDEHCMVRLLDKSVSREHCKISIRDGKLMLIDAGASNKAVQNGNKVYDSTELHSGDTLKFGREVLHVDYIQRLDGSDSKERETSERSGGHGGTQSLF